VRFRAIEDPITSFFCLARTHAGSALMINTSYTLKLILSNEFLNVSNEEKFTILGGNVPIFYDAFDKSVYPRVNARV